MAKNESRASMNLLEPSRRFSLQAIERNADEIQAYLRDRGYYKATVEHAEEPAPTDATGTKRIVVYTITPGEQAHVGSFVITGLDVISNVKPTLKLQSGAPFTRDVLGEDVNRIRQALIATGRLAPQLKDPEVQFDSEKNEINVALSGKVGPLVEVTFNNYTLSEKKQLQLL